MNIGAAVLDLDAPYAKRPRWQHLQHYLANRHTLRRDAKQKLYKINGARLLEAPVVIVSHDDLHKV